ncbi:MAG: GAF domain-containing protein, partial [Chloroflexi bacterium]|nr:GAF domain-containing protein [Chloroflexota bacterium]
MSDASADYQLIHQMMTAVNGANTLDEVMQVTCETAVALFDIDHSGMVIFEQDGTHGKVVAEFPDFGTKGMRIPVNGVMAEEEMLTSKRPLILTNVPQTTTLGSVHETLTQLKINSILIIPVLVNDAVFGSFSLDIVDRTRQFSEREVDLCQILATQVGTAVANVHLLTKATKHLSQMEQLYETGLELVAQVDKTEMLQSIIGQAISLLDAKSGGIYEFDELNQTLTLKADYSREEMMLGVTLQFGEGAAGRLLAEEAPYLIVSDYEKWPDRASVYQGKQFFGAVIEVPLHRNGKILGVLYIDDEVSRQFTHADAQLLQRFADQAAVTLEKAAAIHGDTSKLGQLERLAQASSEIMGQLGDRSLQDILDLIAHHAALILDAETCSICLVKREGYLRFEACYGYTANDIQVGREFKICSGEKSGLTGHIAHEGQLFNAHGELLRNHPAVKGVERPYMASRECYSMLAIPLNKQQPNGDTSLLGLLRVDNKQDSNGRFN